MNIIKRIPKVKFNTSTGNIQSLLIQLLKRREFNYEELANTLNIDGGDVRSRIHIARESGIPIIDYCYIDSITGRKRKKYYMARDENEYLGWRCDQAYESIPIRKGAPSYNYNR